MFIAEYYRNASFQKLEVWRKKESFLILIWLLAGRYDVTFVFQHLTHCLFIYADILTKRKYNRGKNW